MRLCRRTHILSYLAYGILSLLDSRIMAGCDVQVEVMIFVSFSHQSAVTYSGTHGTHGHTESLTPLLDHRQNYATPAKTSKLLHQVLTLQASSNKTGSSYRYWFLINRYQYFPGSAESTEHFRGDGKGGGGAEGENIIWHTALRI